MQPVYIVHGVFVQQVNKVGGGFGSFSRVERLNSEFYKVYSVPVSGGDQRQKTAIGPFCDTLTWHWTWFDGTRFEVFFKNQDRVSLSNFSFLLIFKHIFAVHCVKVLLQVLCLC